MSMNGLALTPDRIKSLREDAGMTQAELTRRLGITRSSVNGWEMGLVLPSTALLIELSRTFHVSTDYLPRLRARGQHTYERADPAGDRGCAGNC